MAEPKKYKLKFPGMPDKQYRENLEYLVKAEFALLKRASSRRGAARPKT